MFDYGRTKNTQQYGSASPPDIPIWNIKNVPIAMFQGKDDTEVLRGNSWKAYKQLKTGVFHREYDNFDHATITTGQ